MTDATAPAATADKVVKLTAMRGMIASKMLESLSTSAQLTHFAECDATGLGAMKARIASEGLKASVEDLIIEAVVQALGLHPALNGTLTGNEITQRSGMNIGVAVALPGDLLVAPAIFNAGAMSLADRVKARRDLVDRAKVNKVTVKEMTGGTFTISNIGLTRVRFFTPILPVPQVAILGVGETSLRPWVVDGQIVPRPIMGLSLTFDHRAVNGAPAGDFLTDLCKIIEGMA
ncbi:MAG TPA: 2-oxo acid dehydrogenase subunit E2 [Hyphomicrobium sp.]|nr:2-oxo acid dehydrogenase subunit E2 [Hyphomicrobium sp.]